VGLGIRKGRLPEAEAIGARRSQPWPPLSGRGEGAPYCFNKPQYFWKPLSQQPVFMHSDWRKPQLVRQIDIELRSAALLQFAMQIFCSPLHRIGAANAAWEKNMASPNKVATRRESKSAFMPASITHRTWF